MMQYAVNKKSFSCVLGFLIVLTLCLMPLVSTYASVPDEVPRFLDCPVTHPYYSSISALSDLGVVSGTGGSMVRPDRPITKAEYMVLLVRLFYPDAPLTPAAPWHLPYQKVLLDQGVFMKKDLLWIDHKISWEFLYASALWAAELYPYPVSLFSDMPKVEGSDLVKSSVYTLMDAGVIYAPRDLKAAPTRGETMDFLYRLSCAEYEGPASLTAFGLHSDNFVVVDLQERWHIRNAFFTGFSMLPQKYIDYFHRIGWDIVIDEIDTRAPNFLGASGLFSGSTSTIYIDSAAVRTTLHEFGHFLWWYLDLQPYAIRMFQDTEECEGLQRITGRGYCQTNASEFFAEAFAAVILQRQTEGGRNLLEKYIPNTYAAIEQGLLRTDALVDHMVFSYYFPAK